MNAHLHRSVGLLVLLAAATTACSGNEPDTSAARREATPSPTSTATPAAGSPESDPLELKLGTGDAESTPSADQIRHFADRVDELTGGQIRIKPVWLAAGDIARFEPAVARQAIAGELDLAVVASRAWDTVGVRSLTPLNAPFLVTSDELVAEVVSEPVQADLLSGLPDAGVVGLGLWPEGLRHPFGFTAPLNEPADYEGNLIRAPHSQTTNKMFLALGADTTDGRVDAATQRGAESSYRLAPAGTATGNVVFYPKVNALVINANVDADLTDDQREALAQAAGDTRDWVLDTLPSDNEAARTFCDEGGRIHSASPAQVKAMWSATRSVVETMSKDEEVARIIDEIAAVADGIEPEELLSDCGNETNVEATKQLNGEYTFTVSPADASEAGVTTQEVIDEGTGTFTVRMMDGTWMLEQVYATGPNQGTSDNAVGDYVVEDGRLTWYWGHEPGSWAKAAFQVEKDGSVTFSDVTDGEGPEWERMAQVHFSHWQRIGDGS